MSVVNQPIVRHKLGLSAYPQKGCPFGRFLTVEAIQCTGQVQRKRRSPRLQMVDQAHAIMQPGYSDACACWPEVPEGLHNGGE